MRRGRQEEQIAMIMRRNYVKRIANKRITCGQVVTEEDVSKNYYQYLKFKATRYFQGIKDRG